MWPCARYLPVGLRCHSAPVPSAAHAAYRVMRSGVDSVVTHSPFVSLLGPLRSPAGKLVLLCNSSNARPISDSVHRPLASAVATRAHLRVARIRTAEVSPIGALTCADRSRRRRSVEAKSSGFPPRLRVPPRRFWPPQETGFLLLLRATGSALGADAGFGLASFDPFVD